MRKSLAILLSLVMVLLLFSACNRTPATDTPTTTTVAAETDGEEPETPEADITEIGTGGTRISFWNGLTGSDGVTLNEMLTQFAQENGEISVTVEIIAWGTLYQKLQTAFVAGTYPDVFMLHASEVPQFASYGVLRNMGDQYTSGGGWFPDDDISETTMYGMKWDGEIWAIPLDNHGRGLWINTDMFEAAGLSTDPIDAPTTYEGWVELFQKLTLDANGNNAASPDFDKDNVVQWGYTVGEWPNVNFLAGITQLGGSILNEDGTVVTVNSQAGIQALQQSVDLVYKYNVSPPAAGFDTWQGFASGSVAVIPTGTWFRNFAATLEDINSRAWTNVQFGPEPAAWFGTHAFMAPQSLSGEKLDAVMTMIRWVSDNQVAWAASGQVPARLSAQKLLNMEEYPSNILLGQHFAEYGVQDPRNPVTQELLGFLGIALGEALNGMKTPEDALNEAATLMQEALDRQ